MGCNFIGKGLPNNKFIQRAASGSYGQQHARPVVARAGYAECYTQPDTFWIDLFAQLFLRTSVSVRGQHASSIHPVASISSNRMSARAIRARPAASSSCARRRAELPRV